MSSVSQIDLNGNPVAEVYQQGADAIPTSPGKLALMAARGADLRLLLVILIALELPVGGLLHAAGC